MAVNATPTSIKASNSVVQMTFSAPNPDGTGSNNFLVQVPAFAPDGTPLDAATISAALIAESKAQYRVKFPPVPVVPVMPVPFQIN